MSLRALLDAHPLPLLGEGGKDDRANVVVVGGPLTCPGAVVLAATAALRSGAGRVRVATHPDVVGAVGVAVPELAVYSWNATASPARDLAAALGEADVVLIGPGYSHLDDAIVRGVVERAAHAVVVLDAGALASAPRVAAVRPLVIAPNPSEARRLLDLEEDDDDEAALASRLADRFERPVAVRGATTVIADGHGTWRFDDSPSGLGTPGSGDVFVGVLSAMLGTLDNPAAALGWAVHLHASSGARLAARTPVGYRASEVVDELPYAITDAMNP
jgi:hydroxyethylthiazole kinase-like uncharacterized protein yjeF